MNAGAVDSALARQLEIQLKIFLEVSKRIPHM